MADTPLVSFHYGDVHFPFHDTRALAVVYAILDDLKPDIVVCHGDLLDCYTISAYEKDPKHRIGLDKEIELAQRHLAEIATLTPGAQRLLLKGNHEDRLRRSIWSLSKDSKVRELLALPQVEGTFDWPNLLNLEANGFTWHEDKTILFNRMIVKHGSVVRRWSGHSAKAEMERYGKSGISGHTHRMGAFFHRDWNGQHGWWELGCLCDLDPDYTEDPDWQQGVAVVTWAPNKTLFSVELIHIHRGRAIFRGKIY